MPSTISSSVSRPFPSSIVTKPSLPTFSFAAAHDSPRQYRRGRRSIAGLVARLTGDLLDHLRAHVLEPVGELDLLRDGHAVLGDARRAVRFVEEDVAAFRAERHLDRIGENIDAAQHPIARVAIKSDFLGSHVN